MTSSAHIPNSIDVMVCSEHGPASSRTVCWCGRGLASRRYVLAEITSREAWRDGYDAAQYQVEIASNMTAGESCVTLRGMAKTLANSRDSTEQLAFSTAVDHG